MFIEENDKRYDNKCSTFDQKYDKNDLQSKFNGSFNK